MYPDDPAARVHARAWERVADTFVDPILVDISYWKWAERADKIPDGLLEAARADLRVVQCWALVQGNAGPADMCG